MDKVDSCCNNNGKTCCGENLIGTSVDDKQVDEVATEEVKGGCCDEGDECCGDQECGGQECKNECCGEDCEIKSACCSDCESSEEEQKEAEALDDATCLCCVNILILGTESEVTLSPKADVVETVANDHRILRSCCKVFEKYCFRKPCCFISPSKSSRPSSSTKSIPQPENKQLVGEKPRIDEDPREKLLLEIRGMDCADCLPKVRRALEQLSSVTSLNVDYFTGTAELLYDPETIKPEAICNYVARATGFGVKVSDENVRGANDNLLTLHLLFPTKPSSKLFEGYDAKPDPNSNAVEVSILIKGETSQRPRDVLKHFETHGATLLPPGLNRRENIVKRDFFIALSRCIASAILTIPVLVFAWAKLEPRPVLYGAISLSLTTIIQGIAFQILSAGMRSIIFLHQVDMNVLVGLSTLSAYIYSVVAYAMKVVGKSFSEPFFETCALLITLILAGRTLASATRRSTASPIENLRVLQPAEVLHVDDTSGSTQTIDARLLYYGDVIRIKPGTCIATDGIVIEGSSDVDESSVTGESATVPKWKGSRVIAGTLNLNGPLQVQVTHLVHENSLSRIVNLVKQSQSSHSPVQDLADKLSAIILPVAVTSACIAFLVWILVGIYIRHQSPGRACVNALTYAFAIIIVSCPCAIGLAIPTVISAATRVALREGVLFRSAEALQTANRIDVVAFDKTGTLTKGSFAVERVDILVPGSEHIIDALVKDNQHPVARGVHHYLSDKLPSVPQKSISTVAEISSLPGKGIKGLVTGFPLLGGSASFAGICSHPIASELQSSGLTPFTVSLGGQPIAFFGLADTPRPGAAALVMELTGRGKEVVMLSGDTPSAVNQLAASVNIPVEKAFASHSPEDKEAAIAVFQSKGKRVLFVGDGTNDGPGLSRADIALAVESGSDVALGVAGAVLLNKDIHRGIIGLLDIATATRSHALWALTWCVVYNVFAILLASGSLVKVRIEPRWAGLGEVVSVLPVVAIGFALQARWKWL